MATKTIAWTTGSGNITLTYAGQGNGSISVASDENNLFEDREQSFGIVTTAGTPEKALSILVKQKGKRYAVGTVFNFDYTGNVQQITLPKGKYKLQCWGAQGGTTYYGNSANGAGSKGGYSEGIITLSETTTFYIFVGGQGSRGSSTSLVNGGWNGGGASVGYSVYTSGDTKGQSYPACGGGATDISTVTSSMTYSSGRTNRSSASLLARCIVAGGGAGGSYRYTLVTTTTTTTKWVSEKKWTVTTITYADGSTGYDFLFYCSKDNTTYTINYNTGTIRDFYRYKSDGSVTWPAGPPFTSVAGSQYYLFISAPPGVTLTVSIDRKETVSNTTESSSESFSNSSQQGGGESGKGQYPGTQTSAGSNGSFGLGANQKSTNYRYCAGGGGGGWYGGGSSQSDSSTSYINYSGGGSGFVNTAANASSRPSGYTGLQLDSGTTKDGSTSFESTSGGTETGHSGNGYARITVVE